MIGEYTLSEVWMLGMYFAVIFNTLFWCALILWAVIKFDTSEDVKKWAKEWRDKPPYDWVADISLIAAMLYLLWIKVSDWRKG